MVCLGDFFDKPTLTDEELTALKQIKWNNITHYFIVGNHESSINGLAYNSTKALESPTHHIIDTPMSMIDPKNELEICVLPYIIESDRKQLKDYFPTTNKRIIFSHNDIKGLQMGEFLSRDGFDINDIQQNCDLFINGHLHNGGWFAPHCLNLGNVTGLNFSEDASRYAHCVLILDTDTLEYQLIENPYAFNFYKMEINCVEDFSRFSRLKSNAVLSIKCNENVIEDCKKYLDDNLNSNIYTYRLVIVKNEVSTNNEFNIEDLSVDHLSKFVEFCKEKITNDSILDKELSEICK